MNQDLLKPYTEEEIQQAVFQMAPFKSPIPDGHIQGISICRRAPSITHLLFADDTQIYCEASTASVWCIKNILDIYAQASGQSVNLNKSSMVFSKNVKTVLRDSLMEILGIRWEEQLERYFGLPWVVGGSRRGGFAYIATVFGRGCKDGVKGIYHKRGRRS
ncbi:UNVERIFIED_CONTAM: hypothetical protein Slati_1711800 [Sesamum latifolium]|uniref:Reverse transcriptase domain-containing protein n=1 Tax=Sesamum latifolium TaxID=2727402 RepID=A0AAW2WW27_9LAMI